MLIHMKVAVELTGRGGRRAALRWYRSLGQLLSFQLKPPQFYLGGFAPQSPAGGEWGEPSPVPHPSPQSSCLLPFHQPPHGPSVQKSRVREACSPRSSPPACPPLEAWALSFSNCLENERLKWVTRAKKAKKKKPKNKNTCPSDQDAWPRAYILYIYTA